MTKCCMTGKIIKCPMCNSGKIWVYYAHDHTHFGCEKCLNDWYSYHHDHENYPEEIEFDGVRCMDCEKDCKGSSRESLIICRHFTPKKAYKYSMEKFLQ